jgi:alpha-pyrone synthase
LGISKNQNEPAYRVLKNYGNMSSPTVLFVLKEIVHDIGVSNVGERVLSFAFGPGITLEGMVLRIESA